MPAHIDIKQSKNLPLQAREQLHISKYKKDILALMQLHIVNAIISYRLVRRLMADSTMLRRSEL